MLKSLVGERNRNVSRYIYIYIYLNISGKDSKREEK